MPTLARYHIECARPFPGRSRELGAEGIAPFLVLDDLPREREQPKSPELSRCESGAIMKIFSIPLVELTAVIFVADKRFCHVAIRLEELLAGNARRISAQGDSGIQGKAPDEVRGGFLGLAEPRGVV